MAARRSARVVVTWTQRARSAERTDTSWARWHRSAAPRAARAQARLNAVRSRCTSHHQRTSATVARVTWRRGGRRDEEAAVEEEEEEEEEEAAAERFSLFYTDEGHKYYVPELGGETLWVLPEGAELIHGDMARERERVRKA